MGAISKNPAAILAIVASILTGIGIIAVTYSSGVLGNDFSVYWRVANGPVADAYSTVPQFPFPYAPTMLLWISPLSAISLGAAFAIWSMVGVGSYIAVCRKHLNGRELFLVLISPAVVDCLITGQVSLALAALLLWSMGTSNRIAAGVVLGMIATIKPQLVALAPLYLIVRGDWRGFAAAAVSFALIVVLALLTFGPQPWTAWIKSMEHFRSVLSEHRIISGGITPASLGERLGLPLYPFMLAGGVVGAWLVWRCRAIDPVSATAVVATASLLASPYALVYDLVPLLPFLAIMIWRGRYDAALALAAFLPPLPTLITGSLLVSSSEKQTKTPGN